MPSTVLLLVRRCLAVGMNQCWERSARSGVWGREKAGGLSVTLCWLRAFICVFVSGERVLQVAPLTHCLYQWCTGMPCCFLTVFYLWATCLNVLAFPFVCNSCRYLWALVSWLNESCIKVPGIQALILSSSLLIISLIGQEMPGLWGYQVLHCGTEMSVCSNLPPWINIQWGFSHFAHLFVEYTDTDGWIRPSYSKGEQQARKKISIYELTFAVHHYPCEDLFYFTVPMPFLASTDKSLRNKRAMSHKPTSPLNEHNVMPAPQRMQ